MNTTLSGSGLCQMDRPTKNSRTVYLPSLPHCAGVSRIGAKISSLPHTWRNLPHGEALWTFTKTTHQNGRFTVKVKQKLKNLKQQRFMWDQKVASIAVNDWKTMHFQRDTPLKHAKQPPSGRLSASFVLAPVSFELGPRPFSCGRGTRKKISRIGIRKSWQV